MNRASLITALAATLYTTFGDAVGGCLSDGEDYLPSDEFFKHPELEPMAKGWVAVATASLEEFFPTRLAPSPDPESRLRHEVFIDKSLRRTLGLTTDVIDHYSESQGSRERSTAKTKVQEAGFWLGANLGIIHDRAKVVGIDLAANPYPTGRDPQSGVVHPPADTNPHAEDTRALLRDLKSRLETIKETVPGIALDSELARIEAILA